MGWDVFSLTQGSLVLRQLYTAYLLCKQCAAWARMLKYKCVRLANNDQRQLTYKKRKSTKNNGKRYQKDRRLTCFTQARRSGSSSSSSSTPFHLFSSFIHLFISILLFFFPSFLLFCPYLKFMFALFILLFVLCRFFSPFTLTQEHSEQAKPSQQRLANVKPLCQISSQHNLWANLLNW